MTGPQVSVIIPAHNAAATLAEAVESVQAQNLNDLEILIVDDGSTDNTLSVARLLACEDGRIRVIAQRNAGAAAARNHGVAKARGHMFAFLDADDAWMPETLLRHVNFLRGNPYCGVSFARICYYDAWLRTPGRVSAYVPELTLARVLGEHPVCTPSNIVARRAAVIAAGLFDDSLADGEDQEFLARMLATTPWQVRGLDAVLVKYRTAAGGLPTNEERARASWMTMLEKVRNYAPQAAAEAEAQASVLFNRFLARRALCNGQARSAIQPMMRAVAADVSAWFARGPYRGLMNSVQMLAAMLPGDPAGRLLRR